MEPGSAGRVLDEVLDAFRLGSRRSASWPCPRSSRAIICAPGGPAHLGLMLVGGTGAGKSAIGVLICRLFDLDPVAMTRRMSTMTESPLGRRVQVESGWRFQPFALLDEFDKADAAATGRAACTRPLAPLDRV
jgi:hypothetical protein